MPDIIIYGLPIATLVLSFLLYREIGKTKELQTNAKAMAVLFYWMTEVGAYRLSTDATFLTLSGQPIAKQLYLALCHNGVLQKHPDINSDNETPENDERILKMYVRAKAFNIELVRTVPNWDEVFHQQLEEVLLRSTVS